jgi:uncharacterized membrane protein YjgN (DUF898 family)
MEQDTTSQNLPFQFTGNAWEYFKIWIVNVFLTVLTLGIYSAWAKVRNKRYFYGNTLVDDSPFEYLASPVTILKGRLIAFALFAVYLLVVSLRPQLEPLFWIAFLILLPWLVVKALSFNARNSAYRNIRFNFESSYAEAAKVFLGFGLLTLITLGLAYPYFTYRQRRFVVANSAFGQTRFDFGARAGEFYRIYLKALGLLLVIALAFAVVGAILGIDPAAAAEPEEPVPSAVLAAALAPLLLILPLYLFVGTYIHTATTNLVMNQARPGEHRLRSTLRTPPMFWIYLSNLVAIVLSMGLLIPWAKVRLARYRFRNLGLLARGDLQEFVADEQQRVRATGEEMADLFDVDLGL